MITISKVMSPKLITIQNEICPIFETICSHLVMRQ